MCHIHSLEMKVLGCVICFYVEEYMGGAAQFCIDGVRLCVEKRCACALLLCSWVLAMLMRRVGIFVNVGGCIDSINAAIVMRLYMEMNVSMEVCCNMYVCHLQCGMDLGDASVHWKMVYASEGSSLCDYGLMM